MILQDQVVIENFLPTKPYFPTSGPDLVLRSRLSAYLDIGQHPNKISPLVSAKGGPGKQFWLSNGYINNRIHCLVSLEEEVFISRFPRTSRSIKLLLSRDQNPVLE